MREKGFCDYAYITIEEEIVINVLCTLAFLLLKTKHKKYFPPQPLSYSFQCPFEMSAFLLQGHEEDIVVLLCTYVPAELTLKENVQLWGKKKEKKRILTSCCLENLKLKSSYGK